VHQLRNERVSNGIAYDPLPAAFIARRANFVRKIIVQKYWRKKEEGLVSIFNVSLLTRTKLFSWSDA